MSYEKHNLVLLADFRILRGGCATRWFKVLSNFWVTYVDPLAFGITGTYIDERGLFVSLIGFAAPIFRCYPSLG